MSDRLFQTGRPLVTPSSVPQYRQTSTAPTPKLKRPLGLHLLVCGGNPAKGPVCGPPVPLGGCHTDCVDKK